MSTRRICSFLVGIAGLMVVSPVIVSTFVEIPSEAVLTLTYNGLILGGIAFIGLMAHRDMKELETEYDRQVDAIWRGIEDYQRELRDDLSRESDTNSHNFEEVYRKFREYED